MTTLLTRLRARPVPSLVAVVALVLAVVFGVLAFVLPGSSGNPTGDVTNTTGDVTNTAGGYRIHVPDGWTAQTQGRTTTVTSAVGRAVVGTLDPERAFEAIVERAVLDGLKLDGLALLPMNSPAAFEGRVASDLDRPTLRAALVSQLGLKQRQIGLRTGPGRGMPDWVPDDVRGRRLAVAAIPCGAGTARPVGGLIAWRELRAGRQAFFDGDEILVLKTLADYAAVTLETRRLAHETARLHHEAGQAEARREMDALRDVARLKDEFLGQVSHEPRTPPAIIHGYAELLPAGLTTEAAMVRQSQDEVHTSTALMLRHGLSMEAQAVAVESAVDRALAEGLRTPDLGGSAGTEEATRAVLKYL